MNFTQASTSPSTIFLPPDPPESPPPEAGPPDRGSPFAGMLEGHTNARTAPAEGVKRKGPQASAAAPAEGSPAPHQGAPGESASAPGDAGTTAAGSGAEAAAQSEPTTTPIGGEASVAAGAAVAV